ncbi:MAG: hypothetical protein HYV13_01240 [Candidatus Doudnabacteria bacterium]|nr:hypothetical protein [Candidatus Doudnabacteria bacterium]
MRSSANRDFVPTSEQVQTMLGRAKSAPVISLAFALLAQLAIQHRRYLEYLRFWEDRKPAKANILAFYEGLHVRQCPKAIRDKVKEIIADISAIPTEPQAAASTQRYGTPRKRLRSAAPP